MISGNTILSVLVKFLMAFVFVSFILSSILSYRNEITGSPDNSNLVDIAKRYLTDDILIEKGKELDCSGFTRLVYRQAGFQIPRSSNKQFEESTVTNQKPELGYLVFFKTDQKHVGHVGIYIGDNKFIHSPGRNKNVKIDSINAGYYQKRYVGTGTCKREIRRR